MQTGSTTARQLLVVSGGVVQLSVSGQPLHVEIAEDGSVKFAGSDSVAAAKISMTHTIILRIHLLLLLMVVKAQFHLRLLPSLLVVENLHLLQNILKLQLLLQFIQTRQLLFSLLTVQNLLQSL